MLPEYDKLEELARTYVNFLASGDATLLRKYLSLDFVTRQRAMDHIKLIGNLPRFAYGFGMEIHLFADYTTTTTDDKLTISPFQFEISYSLHLNLIEVEKATLTVHAVSYKDNEWKIDAIVSGDEQKLLEDMIKKFKQA